MAKLIWFFKRVSYRILAPLFPETISKWRIQEYAKNYDMYTEDNEEYYVKLYLRVINHELQQVFGNKKLKILDAGCGQGRLSIPLAIMGHTVEGIDFSRDVIKLAKKYASEKNLNNIYFYTKDIEEPFDDEASEKYDCILCTEVIYMAKDYNKILSELYRMLKTSGLMFIAFREKYFYLLYYIKNKSFKDAEFILSNSKTLGGLNLHTHQEMLEILSRFRLKDIKFHGIGICSGIEGDPLSSIAEPKNLTSDEQEILFEIETTLSQEYSKAGRYILTSGIKY